MRLTTKGRYAVTAIVDLALNEEGRPVTLAEISGRQDTSLAYLEQLFSKLRRAGLVRSTRGPGGGYSLGREPSAINVADVILAVDEGVDTTRCGGLARCHNDQACLTHDLWMDLNAHIHSFLEGVTLADLVERARCRGQSSDAAAAVQFLRPTSL